MTPEQFCYWLQGYFELGSGGRAGMTDGQVETIKDHLNLVFTKVTPDRRPKGEILNEEIRKAQMNRPGVTCGDGKIC